MDGVTELLVLRLLRQEEMYGYEIVQEIRSRTDAVIAVGEGVVYQVLHGLERDGALTSRRDHIRRGFSPGSSAQEMSASLIDALVIFSVALMPYFIWRLQSVCHVCASSSANTRADPAIPLTEAASRDTLTELGVAVRSLAAGPVNSDGGPEDLAIAIVLKEPVRYSRPHATSPIRKRAGCSALHA